MPNNLISEVLELRSQGLSDAVVKQELQSRGYLPSQVEQALQQADTPYLSAASGSGMPAPDQGNIYERIEEITESIVDEKWDDLIAEVKKIVEWKESLEQKQAKVQADLDKLKENFAALHQGVLGRLEDYDERMQDVGTELKAVGKVFKDVIPVFVENVKELKSVTEKAQGKH
jgi:phage shock protein A